MKHHSGKLLKGLVFVSLTSLLLLYIFFGNTLLSLNSVLFSVNGDGIQSYFNTSYQIRHDTTIFYTKSINYPYGEAYIYTQPQLPVVILVKLISNWSPGIKDHIIGIMNSMMLFSIVLGAAFLFLTFHNLKLPLIVSVPASAAIACFSPQIDRMQGHFTLSYVWAIPLLIFLLLLFHQKRNKILYSILISISLFILATLHIYYVAFAFVLSFSYLLVSLIIERNSPVSTNMNKLLYFSVQFVLPLLLYFIISGYFGDSAPERPSKPYGFLLYKARPESIFLPVGLKYGQFLNSIRDFSSIQWEGIAYIGLTAVIGFVFIGIELLTRLYKRSWKSILKVTDNLVLNVVFWASLVLLIYSFGIPFVLGLEFLTDYIGPIKQLRAIGRFSWLFFYIVNIVVIYRIWHWRLLEISHNFVVVISMMMLLADSFFYLTGRKHIMNNRPAEWIDNNGKLPVNRMLARLNAEDYQAIIPVPFYHMGSENFNIPFRCDMLTKVCYVSLRTGIPIMAINSGRASVSQSAKNIATVLEPYREYEILKDIQDRRPFLIVTGNCTDITESEKNLISNSTLVDSSSGYLLYRLNFENLAALPARNHSDALKVWRKTIDKSLGQYSNISESEYFYLNYDTLSTGGYKENAASVNGRLMNFPFRGKILNAANKKYLISYWLKPIDKDLFPKTRLLVELANSEGEVYSYQNVMSGDYIKAIDSSWGLIEYPFELENSEDEIRITIYNDLISKHQSYFIDELLIRPDGGNFVITSSDFLMINNRWYSLN